MNNHMSFYRCKHCGNIITFLKESGAPVSCCGEPMTKLTANTTDASLEKHVPAISKKDGMITVNVGSVLHPMLPEHYIEWIACVAGNQFELKYLQPGDVPSAEFSQEDSGTIYAYCNLHGLWKHANRRLERKASRPAGGSTQPVKAGPRRPPRV